ncbi:MAG: hypothetical protein NUV73_00955 [Candidatus Daviesbacteria bacterium]|nr:hypothetical protein [Candidatus Daviesbacteria bacterium]
MGDIVVIPREDRFVYTIYKAEEILPEVNRVFIKTPNQDNIALCRGDSGAPVLKYPINGEVFGVLTSARNLKPETSLSPKDCATEMFFRPNG